MPSRNEALPTVMRRLAAGKMLMEGASVSDIAAQLHISENTVRSHLKKAQEKLGAQNRTQAVAEALRQKLIP